MRVLALVVAVLVALPAGAASGGDANGRYLVWAGGTGSGPVVEIVDGSGHVDRVVADVGHARDVAARWSPDGSLLAWIGDGGLSVESSAGGAARLLVPASSVCRESCSGLSFAWSPDGRSLAVGGAGPQTNRLLVVSATTGAGVDAAPATPDTNYRVFGWTPDGRSLVYSRGNGDLGHAGCCRSDIRMAAADGSHMRVVYRLPDPFADGGGASLSPDGRTVAIATQSDDGRRDIFRFVDLRSGRVRDIGGLGVLEDQPPAWSPDSRRLALPRLYRPFATVSVGGGHVRTLGARGIAAFWGATGGILILRGKDGGQVWVSRGGKPARPLFRIPGGVSAIDVRRPG